MSHLPTTNAGVRYISQSDFDDLAPGTQIWLVEVKVDGPAPNISTEIRFAGNATAAQKRSAARKLVNEHLAYYEPATTPLTDAVIQISGQPT